MKGEEGACWQDVSKSGSGKEFKYVGVYFPASVTYHVMQYRKKLESQRFFQKPVLELRFPFEGSGSAILFLHLSKQSFKNGRISKVLEKPHCKNFALLQFCNHSYKNVHS